MAWAIPIHDYRIQLPSSWPTETGLKNVWVEEYKLGQSMLPHDVFSISMHLLLSHFKSKPCSFFTLYIHPRTITTNATHCKLHKQDNFYLIKDKKKYIFIFNIKKRIIGNVQACFYYYHYYCYWTELIYDTILFK